MVLAAECSGRKQQIAGRERKDGSQVLSEKSPLSLLQAEQQQNIQFNLKVGINHNMRLARVFFFNGGVYVRDL